MIALLTVVVRLYFVKTIMKKCFAPRCSLCCFCLFILLFFLANLRWRNAQLCLLMSAQSDRTQLAVRPPLPPPPPPLLFMVQTSCFCAVVWSLVIVRGRHFLVLFLLEPVRPPPFVTPVSMTNFEQRSPLFFFSRFSLLVVLFCYWICIQ